MLRWLPGRQGTDYQKLPLITWPFFDCYLLRYPKGSSLPWHTDPVPGRRHFRLNIELKRPKSGGTFLAEEPALFKGPRITLFRPDTNRHALSRVGEGGRLVLSVGWAVASADS